MKRQIGAFFVSFCLLILSSCALFQKAEDIDPFRPYDIHYAGVKVGTATFESIIVPGSAGQRFRDFIVEEIVFSGTRYRFEFIYEDGLEAFTIIRYHGETDQIILGNSYRLVLENDMVRRTYIDESGNFRNTRSIQDRNIIRNTQTVFTLSNQFIRSYYVSRTVAERRATKMPSLGYQLLIQDRL